MKLGELVEKYIKRREALAQLKAEYQARVAKVEGEMELIEAKFLEMFDRLQCDNLAVRGVGTVYKDVRTSASCADKEAFMRFVRENDEFDLLEVRPAKKNVEQYMQVHQELPPGVNFNRQVTVKFQRAAHASPATATAE